jgi:c(7)-type cytochrome triheme protein
MKLNKKYLLKLLTLLLCTAVLALFSGQAIGDEEEEAEEDGGRIIFTKPVKAVVFDHKSHTEAGLDCESCHSDDEMVFEMSTGTAEENVDFTMKSLYAGKYCGACHDGDTAFASSTRCTMCHIGVKGYDRTTGDTSKGGHGGGH